jgi:hypothetical protein
MNDCQLVADYGGYCGDNGYLQLTAAQIATFYTGPAMTNVLGTREGARYYVKSGVKQEILDSASQAEAGIPSAMNVLTEAALADLKLGAPIVRDGSVARDRNAGDIVLISGGLAYRMAQSTAVGSGLAARQSGGLWAASLAMLGTGPTFNGVIRSQSSGLRILSDGTAYPWKLSDLPSTPVNQRFFASFPLGSELGDRALIKSSTSPRVYVVDGGAIRPVLTWEAIATISGPAPIVTLPPASVEPMPVRPAALQIGSLVRTASNVTVYLIDGMHRKIALPSFDPATEAGFKAFNYVDEESLAAYETAPDRLGYGFICGAAKYVAAGGVLHEVPDALLSAYQLTYTQLDALTCGQTSIGAPATAFIRTSDGKISQLVDGIRRPVTSLARFGELEGWRVGYLDVSAAFASSFPVGADA